LILRLLKFNVLHILLHLWMIGIDKVLLPRARPEFQLVATVTSCARAFTPLLCTHAQECYLKVRGG